MSRVIETRASERNLPPDPARLGLSRRFVRGSVCLLLPAGAFLFCYWQVVHDMVATWATSRMYSYGFLIPPTALYLIWRRRQDLRRTPVYPSHGAGTFVLAGSILLLAIGQASGMTTIQAVSLLPGLTGLVLLLFGTRILLKLLLPLAYLLFMLPVWELLTQPLHPPLQQLSAHIAVAILRVCGITVAQEGTTMILPNITLEVAPDCSGVNYLVAVVAVGIPATYIFLQGFFLRSVLVLGAVVVAGLGNGVRIGLVGILAYNDVGSAVHGPFHILQGMIISILGFLVILVGIVVLARKQREKANLKTSDETESFSPVRRETGKTGWTAPILASAVLLLGGGYLHFYKPSPVPLGGDLDTLPVDIGVWKGRNGLPSQCALRIPNADRELLRVYRNASGAVAEVYIGYFDLQREGKELVSSRTKRLHAEARKEALPENNLGTVEVNKTISVLRQERRLILSWYELGGTTLRDPYRVKWDTTWRALTIGRTEGAYVAVATTVESIADEEARLRELKELAAILFPLIKEILSASPESGGGH